MGNPNFDKNAATAKKVAGAIHEAAKWANNPKNFAEVVDPLAKYRYIPRGFSAAELFAAGTV